jgi:hypothetical protein
MLFVLVKLYNIIETQQSCQCTQYEKDAAVIHTQIQRVSFNIFINTQLCIYLNVKLPECLRYKHRRANNQKMIKTYLNIHYDHLLGRMALAEFASEFVSTVYFHIFQENVSITKSKMSPRIQVLILHVCRSNILYCQSI